MQIGRWMMIGLCAWACGGDTEAPPGETGNSDTSDTSTPASDTSVEDTDTDDPTNDTDDTGGTTDTSPPTIDERADAIEGLVSTADEASGQASYEGTPGCHECHQLDGSGTTTFPALTQRLPLLDDREVALTILTGRPAPSPGGVPMPAYADFWDDQRIADTIAYLRSAFDP